MSYSGGDVGRCNLCVIYDREEREKSGGIREKKEEERVPEIGCSLGNEKSSQDSLGQSQAPSSSGSFKSIFGLWFTARVAFIV